MDSQTSAAARRAWINGVRVIVDEIKARRILAIEISVLAAHVFAWAIANIVLAILAKLIGLSHE